ncbi:hypothetical protein PybrP1_010043 [[Pythium] brassicae (nom. inval.)]|nr:hypothetical protein PybrP1_010043 [[Pythium] brassicae (nom. inval.)]
MCALSPVGRELFGSGGVGLRRSRGQGSGRTAGIAKRHRLFDAAILHIQLRFTRRGESTHRDRSSVAAHDGWMPPVHLAIEQLQSLASASTSLSIESIWSGHRASTAGTIRHSICPTQTENAPQRNGSPAKGPADAGREAPSPRCFRTQPGLARGDRAQRAIAVDGLARSVDWARRDASSQRAREACSSCTPDIVAALCEYAEENCSYTLVQMQEMIAFDFGVQLSKSTISRKLLNQLYTVKEVSLHFSCTIILDLIMKCYASLGSH